MAKGRAFAPYRHTLLLRDADERVINGLASAHEIEGSKQLAESILRLDQSVAAVSIHSYSPFSAAVENEKPLARLTLDDLEGE